MTDKKQETKAEFEERELVAAFINGIQLPVIDKTKLSGDRIELVEAFDKKINSAIVWAAKKNKLPF